MKRKFLDTSDQIQQAVLLGVLKDTNFALVSTAPARLHCYLLDKAQFGLLKPVLTQGYQVFLSYYTVYIYSWSVKDTDKCRDNLNKKKKKSGAIGFWEEPCAPLAAVQSFSLPRSCRHSGKTAAHSTWITVCLTFHVVFISCPPHSSCHTSNPVVVANGKWI